MYVCMYVWLSTEHEFLWLDSQFDNILTDRDISESDPLV